MTQMAYYLILTIHIQVVSTYWMIWCLLGQNLGNVGHDLDLKIAF